jgi:hypothetical protein
VGAVPDAVHGYVAESKCIELVDKEESADLVLTGLGRVDNAGGATTWRGPTEDAAENLLKGMKKKMDWR